MTPPYLNLRDYWQYVTFHTWDTVKARMSESACGTSVERRSQGGLGPGRRDVSWCEQREPPPSNDKSVARPNRKAEGRAFPTVGGRPRPKLAARPPTATRVPYSRTSRPAFCARSL